MWSKLVHTTLGVDVRNKMIANDCDYHTWGHVLKIYSFYEKNGVPYDINLDIATLGHDIVYDNQADKEVRSLELIVDMSSSAFLGDHADDVDYYEVEDIVLGTVEHRIGFKSRSNVRWMIRGDLHELGIGERALHNYMDIKKESLKLYNIDSKTFAENSVAFMSGLRRRVLFNVESDAKFAPFWRKVGEGVDETIALSQMVLRK